MGALPAEQDPREVQSELLGVQKQHVHIYYYVSGTVGFMVRTKHWPLLRRQVLEQDGLITAEGGEWAIQLAWRFQQGRRGRRGCRAGSKPVAAEKPGSPPWECTNTEGLSATLCLWGLGMGGETRWSNRKMILAKPPRKVMKERSDTVMGHLASKLVSHTATDLPTGQSSKITLLYIITGTHSLWLQFLYLPQRLGTEHRAQITNNTDMWKVSTTHSHSLGLELFFLLFSLPETNFKLPPQRSGPSSSAGCMWHM